MPSFFPQGKAIVAVSIPSISVTTCAKWFMVLCMQVGATYAKVITYFELKEEGIGGKLSSNDKCQAHLCDGTARGAYDLVEHNPLGITRASANSSLSWGPLHLISTLCYGRLDGTSAPGIPIDGDRLLLFASNETDKITNQFPRMLESMCHEADSAEALELLKVLGIIIGGVVVGCGLRHCAPVCWAVIKRVGNNCQMMIGSCRGLFTRNNTDAPPPFQQFSTPRRSLSLSQIN